MAARKPPAPPSTGKYGAKLWRKLVADFEFTDGELALVEAAAGCYDRMLTAQEALRDGLIVETPAGPRPHPAAAIARDNSNLLGRHLKALGIPEDEDEAPRYRRGARPGPRPKHLRSA